MKPRAVLLLAALAACHLVLRGQGRGVPLITDEGEYSVAARAWSEGRLPYRDAFSQKPPMTFLFYRAAEALAPGPESPRLAGHAASAATVILMWFCAPAAWPLAARLAAPAAFAGLAASPIGGFGFTANTETFVNLFAVAASALLLAGNPFVSGLAAGAALCSKQTFLWSGMLLGLFAAWRGGRRELFRYAAGCAAVPAAFHLYFAARGAAGDYWSAAWGGNARYAAAIVMTGALAGQLSWFATTLLPRLALFAAPALAAAAWGLRGLRAGPARPAETVSVLWLGGAFAGALTGLFLFPHYFLQLAPPLALAAACGVARLERRLAAGVCVVLAAWPALLAPRTIFGESAHGRAHALLHPNPLFESEAMGAELSRRAAPGDRLLVHGSEGALYPYSGLLPATKHTLSYALTLFGDDARVDADLSAIEAASPRWLVWSNQPLSTMIATRAGERWSAAVRLRAEKSCAPRGRVLISSQPAFEPQTAVQPWAEDAPQGLYLFECAKR